MYQVFEMFCLLSHLHCIEEHCRPDLANIVDSNRGAKGTARAGRGVFPGKQTHHYYMNSSEFTIQTYGKLIHPRITLRCLGSGIGETLEHLTVFTKR